MGVCEISYKKYIPLKFFQVFQVLEFVGNVLDLSEEYQLEKKRFLIDPELPFHSAIEWYNSLPPEHPVKLNIPEADLMKKYNYVKNEIQESAQIANEIANLLE